MAAIAFASSPVRRTSLATIDRVVSARLGPTRVPGNEQPACFNRQIAMYLARHVGGGARPRSGDFITGVITPPFAMAFNGLNLYARVIRRSIHFSPSSSSSLQVIARIRLQRKTSESSVLPAPELISTKLLIELLNAFGLTWNNA